MRRDRKPRRLPLPRSWPQRPPSPARSPATARHWLDRHEAEREEQDELLKRQFDQELGEPRSQSR